MTGSGPFGLSWLLFVVVFAVVVLVAAAFNGGPVWVGTLMVGVLFVAAARWRANRINRRRGVR